MTPPVACFDSGLDQRTRLVCAEVASSDPSETPVPAARFSCSQPAPNRRNLIGMAVELGLGVLAIVIMAGLPILILIGQRRASRRLDEAIHAIGHQQVERRLEQRLEQRLEHHRNVRALKHQHGPPIERLGADLRRLRHLIQHSEHHSASQQEALRRAYDSALVDTCRMLSVEHELDLPTTGFERDIERVRVEANLESRGIVLTPPRRHDLNADH